MADFEPHNSWLALRDKAQNTANPLHRQLLEGVATHMEAEIKGQLEPLMATLTSEPVYHFWRVGPQNMVLSGYDEVAGFYSTMFANKGNQFQVVCERIIVDDTGVITEGQVRQVYQRDALKAMGVTQCGEQSIDASELWLSNAQLITVWPAADDGKLVGEDIYFGEDAMATLSPFRREDLPAHYVL